MKPNEYMIELGHKFLETRVNIDAVVDVLHATIKRKSSIWIMGNGGSASTSDHFETDLSFFRVKEDIGKVKACSLTSNSSMLTAASNDIGFENVFSIQLKRKASSGDLSIFISASGNSINLLRAAEFCKAEGIATVGILGFDGGELLKMVDIPLLFPTEIGNYGHSEDLHLAVCHAISAQLLKRMRNITATE